MQKPMMYGVTGNHRHHPQLLGKPVCLECYLPLVAVWGEDERTGGGGTVWITEDEDKKAREG